jgi:hypothetical protein
VNRGLEAVVPTPSPEHPKVLLSNMESISAGPLLRCGYRYLSMAEALSEMLRKVRGTLPLKRGSRSERWQTGSAKANPISHYANRVSISAWKRHR